MSNILITVIIPVYNAETYLNRGIDSVLNQTYESFELILVNDGSEDGSLRICNEYAKRDSRVRVISQDNSGVSVARNTGIKAALGKYIMFIDSDDYIKTNFIEEALKDISSENADIYISGYFEEIYEGDKVLDVIETKGMREIKNVEQLICNMSQGYATECIQVCWAKLYLREIIEKYNILFNSNMAIGEDQVFNCNYLYYTKKIVFSDKSYYYYRKPTDSSLTGRYNGSIYDISRSISESISKLKPLISEDACKNIDIHCAKKISNCIQYMFIHYEESGRNVTLDTIRKISKDEFVEAAMRYKEMFGFRDRLTLFLLKHNLVYSTYNIFSSYFFLKGLKTKVSKLK